ncbi:MAG: penicillin-binding protein 2 [Patescibacteria group bacterium]|jgi:penicillin-binding protein 2
MANPFATIEPIAIKRKSRLNWVEDSCDLSNSLESGVETGYLNLSLSGRKIRWFFLLIALALAVVLVKSFWLQIISGEHYFSLAENNRIKTEYVKAHRGIIFDRNGQPLVNNLFGFSLSLLPAELPKDEAVRAEEIKELSGIIDMPEGEIEARLVGADENYYQPVTLRVGVPYEQAMIIKIKADDLPGAELNVDSWRLYPISESLSHILGYIGKLNQEEYRELSDSYLMDANIGKAGLEKQYESNLRGINGQEQIEVDALGREKKVISQNQSVPGDNVVLSLDAALQEKIYEVLNARVKGKKASVIVSNPQNGEILAMVDYPSFDNNLFTGGISADDYKKLLADPNNPLFTRSIFGEYPSGSTVKPVIASAALEEKIITKGTTVNSVGGIRVGQWYFPDWQSGGHGVTNVTKAIAWSVNTFFYYIGGGYGDFAGLGLERLVKYFKSFGLGQATGIDLPGERPGFVPDAKWKEDTKNEVWYIGDTYHLSIGQGDLLVTPLQVNNYTAAVANGGKLIKPHLAVAIIKADGTKQTVQSEVIRQIPVSAENLAIVREGMRQTVTAGSAGSLNALPVAVAGKTGTAQWSSTKANHAWFAGFAPYDNPNFCITVLVEEGGEGSSVSVPIARDIMQWWFTR